MDIQLETWQWKWNSHKKKKRIPASVCSFYVSVLFYFSCTESKPKVNCKAMWEYVRRQKSYRTSSVNLASFLVFIHSTIYPIFLPQPMNFLHFFILFFPGMSTDYLWMKYFRKSVEIKSWRKTRNYKKNPQKVLAIQANLQIFGEEFKEWLFGKITQEYTFLNFVIVTQIQNKNLCKLLKFWKTSVFEVLQEFHCAQKFLAFNSTLWHFCISYFLAWLEARWWKFHFRATYCNSQ